MNTFLEDILAQPAALQLVLADLAGKNRPGLEKAADLIKSASRIVLTSMGSAYYSLFPMAYSLSRLHSNVHLAETSELAGMPFFPGSLYIIFSRSGESGEIAEFSDLLRQRGEQLIAVTMTPSSTLAKNASLVIHDIAPYDGFICTKAYSSLALAGLLICSVFEGTFTPILEANLHDTITWMEVNKQHLVDEVRNLDWLGASATFLSRGAGLGLAMSGALWLEEAARVSAAHMSIANFLHGPVEQVDEHFHGVWIDLQPDVLSASQYRKICSKQGHLATIAPGAAYSNQFKLPAFDLPAPYRVLPAALPVQLLAYQSAANLGLEAGEMRYLDWVIK
jgi:glucosamine 6-phosphate synthetase-like amidotransferase/phosphosugar isomerase protein